MTTPALTFMTSAVDRLTSPSKTSVCWWNHTALSCFHHLPGCITFWTVSTGKFFAGLANLRLRLNGRPCDLADFVGRVNDSLIFRVLQFDGIGGVFTQAQLLIRLQNLLVEHGVPKAESKARAGIVWDALGSSKVSTVFATKEPWSALKQEAASKGIQLVTIAERYITESSDDAWSKYRLSQSKDQESNGKGKGKDKDNRKSRSRKWDTDVIGETTLDLTFLEGGNNSVTKISYEALEQGSAGVCILPFATVSEKRDIIFNRSFSASPAIILTIGQVEPPPGKESRCVFITIPGWLADKPVALNCTLVQVGDQPFTIPEAKEITSAIPVHTVCMIQVGCRSFSLSFLARWFCSLFEETWA